MAEKFNAFTVELEDSKLIEASAGTGKTYSIAILALRLILEKKIPVQKILMVTFTKAAVAELESRIRKFIRLAYKHASGKAITESRIIETVGIASPEKAGLLRDAVQNLDNLSVMTIHSFCQNCITNYPFETGQSFECELMTDLSELTRYFVNDYWRKEINTIKYIEVFRHLQDSISIESISKVVSKSLDDKEYVYNTIDKEAVLNDLRALIVNFETAEKNYEDHINDNWGSISKKGSGSKYPTDLINKNNNPQAFAKEFLGKCKGENGAPNYFDQFFPEELYKANLLIEAGNNLKEVSDRYVYFLYSEIIVKLKKQITDFKYSRNVISYDDLITGMHNAVLAGSINNVILSQYDAVFIDEFQDTDINQYEIFSRIFSPDKIVFYIGDPKQSIYSWRKADIETYKKAREEVESVRTMNENYRSTEDLISALNQIFAIENPFHDKDIPYQAVDKGDSALGDMTENGIKVIPVAINHFPNNEEITNFVKNEILRLLTTENALINGQPIQPSDIAVLTRTNLQADGIKKALSSVSIPSVTIDQTSVLESQEAGSILSLLSVVLKPDIGGINRVLLNDFFGLTRTDIEKLDPELHLDLFRELRSIWQDSGIYNFLFRFYDAYQVRKHCLDKGIIGQRALSNFYQIAEILHQVSLKTRYSSEELIVWLQREKTKKSEDYEQRIESEDNAVKIITIHKSKGLTFRIVFAPFLDLTIKDDVEIYDFRDTDGYKFTHDPDDRQSELYRIQSEQENRRLIYVALTRAQYKLYICENRYFTDSSLKQFLKIEGPLFENNLIREPAVTGYHSPAAGKVFIPRPNPGIEIKNTFGIHSFSGLSKAHHSAPFESADLNEKDKYDQFIFQDLGRGASVGTALHSIFERLNFAEPETWEQTLKDASKYYSTIIKEESLDHLMQLVNHIMNTEVLCDGEKFALNRIKSTQKLPEMQFYFSMDSVNKTEINKILGEEADLEGEADIEGLMTGFIDLLFEYNGKYFILDWKSNHLGNSTVNYNRAGMEEAMKGSNYNLQYMIYTVAVKRWLEKRIENFNYEKQFGGIIYVFLRGVREGSDTGIFTTKSQTDKIESLEKLLSHK